MPTETNILLLAAALLAMPGPALAAPAPLAAPAAATLAKADALPLTLEAAIDAALNDNIDMVTARNAAQTAAAGVKSADTFPNPIVSIGANQLAPGGWGQTGYNTAGDDIVRIDQPIERGGKRRARVATARDALAAAGSDIADTGRRIRADVAAAWFDLLASERRLALYEGIADSYRQSAVLAERRLAAGAISVGDLARQRVESLRAESDRSRAASDLRSAQLALAILIGREAEAPRLTTLGGWDAAGTPALVRDAEALVDRRPDVIAAEQRVSEARHGLDAAHALRHPDISIGAQYEYNANGPGGVGLGIAFPLQIGNRYTGEIEAAGVALAEAEAQAAKVRSVALAEIGNARRAAEDAGSRRALYDEQLLPQARKAATTAEFAFDRGALALVDLLDARRTLQSVELAAIDAHADEAKALARLAAAETLEETP